MKLLKLDAHFSSANNPNRIGCVPFFNLFEGASKIPNPPENIKKKHANPQCWARAQVFEMPWLGPLGGGPGVEESLAGAFGRGTNCFG